MRRIRHWLSAVALLSSLFAGAASAQATHSVYLDLDNNAGTGCNVATPAGAVNGVEMRLQATISGSMPPMVTQVTRTGCVGGAFGSPQNQSANYPVGLNNGTAGSDVIEIATQLVGLGSGGPVRITVVSQTVNGADIVSGSGIVLDGTQTAPPPAMIPTTGFLGLLLLIGLMLWIARRHPGFGSSMALLLLLGAGIVWAANFVTDGQVGDWTGVAPLANDGNNDATSGEDSIELVSLFAAVETGRLFVRADVLNAETPPNATPVATDAVFALAENSPNGTAVGSVIATDADAGQTLSYAITSGNTGGAFAINAGTGAITVANAAAVDFETTPTFNLIVTVTDNGTPPFSDTAAITVNLSNVNEAPVLNDQTFAVLEASANGTVVATPASAEPDAGQTLTWSITGGNALGAFAINPATGQITVADSADVTIANSPFVLTVQVTDNGTPANLSDTATITINVTDINIEPSFTIASDPAAVSEDAGAQTVAAFATAINDNDGGTQTPYTFSVTANSNTALFAAGPAIDGTGTLTYTPAPNANGVATITVQMQDSGGTAGGGDDTSQPDTFTITVNAVNDAPVFTAGPTQNVLQDAGAQTVDPWATGIGPGGGADEATQSTTFAVTNNTNAALFSVAPAIGPTGALTYTPATGAIGTADITITLSDDGGTANGGVDTSAAQTFTINVNNVNDAPAFTVPASAPASLEDAGAQTVAAFATGIDDGDPPVAQTLTFNVTGNTNAALFAAGPAIDPVTGNLTYTAAANANGSASITVTLSDDGGTLSGGVDTSAPQSFTISVTAVNDEPAFTAGPDENVLQDAGPQTVDPWATGLSAGPADEAGQTLSFSVSGNTNAALFSAAPAISPTGALTYTPAAGVVGSADVTIALQDNGGTTNGGDDTSATQTFTINVNNVNDAPTFTVPANAPASLEDAGAQTVAGFASGIDDGDPPVAQNLTFNVTGNSNPTLFATAPAIDAITGNLTYTAAANANGSASITVTLSDDGGTGFGGVDTSAPQSFTINVTAVNDEPAFTAGPAQSVLENSGAATVNPWATGISAGPVDEAGQTLAFVVIGNTNPALFGTAPAVSPSGVLTFAPAANTIGSADITLFVSDDGGTANGGDDTSATQTFTISVNNVNDAPVFTVPAAATPSLEDGGAQTVNGFATGIDDGDAGVTQALTFNITGNTNPALFATAPAINPANGALTYTAAANANGTASITVTLSDDGGTANGGADTSAPQTFTIDVTAVNDMPSFTVGPDQNILENAGAQTVNPWATALSAGPANESGQTLSFVVSGNTNAALFSVAPAVSPTGVLTYTTAADASGSATITLAIQDNGGTANGGVDLSPTQTFTINVANVNAAPSFTAGPNQMVNEDAGAQTVNPWATAIDDNDPGVTQVLTFNITGNSNPALFAAAPSVSPTGVLTYTPAANASGTATITLTLSDDGGTASGGADTSAPQNFTITVNPVNDAPSFTAGANQTVNEDSGAQTVNPWATAISAGPADEAGQTLTFNITGNTSPALFSAGPSISSTGELTYTPAANASGVASITVTLSDDGGTANGGVDTSPAQNFTITINGVNDAPTFTVGANQTVNEDAGAQTANPWITAFDDGDPGVTQNLTFQITANTNAALFSAGPVVSSTGVLTYTPAPNAFGIATITLQLMDDGGTANGGIDTSATQNFTITVNPVNDAPVVATAPSATVHTNIAIDQPDDATNDLLGTARGITDVDSTGPFVIAPASIGTFATAAGGSITITADGHYHYNPQLHDTGADSFVYQVCDNEAVPACSGVTLGLTISGLDIVFVNDDAPAGGDGTLERPLQTLGAGIAALAGNVNVFLFGGTYAGGATLPNGVRVFGAASGAASFDALYAITPPALSIARPALATPTTIAGGAVGITLGQNNTLRGFSFGNTTSFSLQGDNFGTLTVSDNVGINNGTDGALDLDNGTLAATFTAVASTASASQGLLLDQLAGTLTLGSTSITGPTTQGILLTASTANINFGNTTVGGGTDGISLQNNSAGTRTFGTLNRSGGTGVGLLHSLGGGITTVTGATTIGTPGGIGISIANSTTPVTFAATTITDPTGTGIDVQNSSGATTFGVTSVGKTSAGTGVNLAGNTGTLTFESLGITAGNGTALAAATNVLITITNAGGALSATGGPAIVASATTFGGAGFSNTTSSGSATQGVSLTGTAGTLALGGGSITTATGVSFFGTGTLGTVTYSGAITKINPGNIVELNGVAAATDTGSVTLSGNLVCGSGCGGIDVVNRDTGTITFSGTTKSLNTAASAAVNLDNNDTATINFTGGGLDIDTTSGIGFNATNGAAAISVPGAVNTIDSTTGIALNVVASNIGAGGLSFRSISSNGAASGIVLNGTGAAGGLTVTGNSAGNCGGTVGAGPPATAGATTAPVTADCTGGTIQNSSGPGIVLTNTSAVSLTRVRVINGGNDGVQGTNVTGFSLISSLLDNNGNAINESGLDFGDTTSLTPDGLHGTGVITNSAVLNSYFNGLSIRNNGGAALTSFNVTGSQFRSLPANGDSNDNVFMEASGTANMAISVTGSHFSSIEGDHFQTAALNSGTLDVTFTNNTQVGGHATPLGQGITINAATGVPGWTGGVEYDVNGNNINNAVSNGASLVLGTSAAGATFSGHTRNNVIGTAGVALSCSTQANAVYIDARGNGTHTSQVTLNTLRRCFDRGVLSEAGDGDSVLNFTMTDNLVDQQLDAGAREAVQTNHGITSTNVFGNVDSNVVCAQIGGAGVLDNNLSHGPGAPDDFRLRKRFEATVRLPGYAGGTGQDAGSLAQVVAHKQGQNIGSAGEPGSASASGTGGGYTGGAACPLPL